MKKHIPRSRLLAVFMALSVLTGGLSLPQMVKTTVIASAAEAADSRILVDINRNDGRIPSRAIGAHQWNVSWGGDEAQATETIGNLTFTLRNGGTAGTAIYPYNRKQLQRQNGIYPRIAMDGVTIDETESGGVIALDITGLSEGTHSLRTWHSCLETGEHVNALRISINGRTTAEGVACPNLVTDDADAGVSYSVFEVNDGETVTVLIEPEGEGNAWLNGFEIDGADPIQGISRITPENLDYHHDRDEGLSWTAGVNAVSHDVYFGTEENSVFHATNDSPEFMGNQTETTYALDEDLSSVPTYYWRVDTIDSEGNVIKGAVNAFQIKRLAFPTAEGYGRFARGGRGGKVIHVTSLGDDVNEEGPLRWALENEIWQSDDWNGVPRIVVFDVGGVIALKDDLIIPQNGGNVYVAGQTAPGDGIALTHYGFYVNGASDVIIRDVRVRVGEDNSMMSTGGMTLTSCDHSLIDHCSISWATDEGFSSRNSRNITFQWNIIAESVDEYNRGCYPSDRDEWIEPNSFAASIGGYTGSYHHNLLLHCAGRNWSLAGNMEQDAVTYGSQADIRNNVVYNWYSRTTDGGMRRVNFVNNYYKAGPESNTDLHLVSVDGNELLTNDMQMLYASGNMMADMNGTVLDSADADEWESGKAVCGEKNATAADIRSDVPFFPSYVNTQTAEEAYERVLTHVGAGGTTGRDYIDSRYIQEVADGTVTYTGSRSGLMGFPDSVTDVGGYPNEETFTHSTDGATNEENDTDRDGMPNVWEEAHGLDPDDPSDGAVVSLSAEDYTNVELYLNELMGESAAFAENVKGDVNADGAFTRIDTVMLQKWISGADCTIHGDAADQNGDGRVNVLDLCLMKRVSYEPS